MNYTYRFPVVKGVQAGRQYYIAMVPLKMLGKLFTTDDEYVPPEYRAQRRLNETRIPEIRKYILDNKDSYVFSALAASIDGNFKFYGSNNEDAGILEVDMDAKFLINDGQHRKAAILSALEEDCTIENETISVVFYEDHGLSRSQQMFTDLNKHAVKTSNSIAELYDSRDLLAVSVRTIISKIPFLNEYVDKERDILGKYSSSLFTLNTFYNASKRILSGEKCDAKFEEFILSFWECVCSHMLPWQDLVNKNISKKDLREQYVATQAITIHAFGKVGAFFWSNNIKKFEPYLYKVENINWKRSSDAWKARVTRNNGRIINNEKAIAFAANYIKMCIDIPLTSNELKIEKSLKVNEN